MQRRSQVRPSVRDGDGVGSILAPNAERVKSPCFPSPLRGPRRTGTLEIVATKGRVIVGVRVAPGAPVQCTNWYDLKACPPAETIGSELGPRRSILSVRRAGIGRGAPCGHVRQHGERDHAQQVQSRQRERRAQLAGVPAQP
jgi:hypothetical protein